MERESIFLLAWRLNKVFPILIGVLVLLNLTIYLLLNYVSSPKLGALERELIDLQASTRQSRQSDAEGNTPAEIFHRGEADLKTFKSAIPAKNEFTALLGEIFSLAEEAGLTLNQIGYDPKELEGQDLLRYGLSFSVRGEYRQIKRFIYSLEQSRRLIVVDGLALSGSEESAEGTVNLSLRLATFFRTDAS